MPVKVVTDSTSDLPAEAARELGITVVPLYVRFGTESYRDGVDLTADEFYRKLANSPTLPTTSTPPPGVFAEVYSKLAEETDEILTIVISSKLSGTYQSATNAKSMVTNRCRIEVIDSQNVAMGFGLLVIAAAQAAQAGASLKEVMDLVNKGISRSHIIIYFETLKYLAKGGRIGKAQGLLGSMLSIKPILTMKDGEIAPMTRVRSKAAGMEYIRNFVAGFSAIEKLAVEHCTTPDDADKLADILSASVAKENIYGSTVSPVLGVHAGPGAIAVTVLEAEKK